MKSKIYALCREKRVKQLQKPVGYTKSDPDVDRNQILKLPFQHNNGLTAIIYN